MKALLLAGALMAPVATSEPSLKVWPGQFPGKHGYVSYVELHEPMVEGAAATITFQNKRVHTGDETFSLTWEGIDVTLTLEKDYDNWVHEGLTVEYSDGYVPEPRFIVVQEDSTGHIHLYPFVGM